MPGRWRGRGGFNARQAAHSNPPNPHSPRPLLHVPGYYFSYNAYLSTKRNQKAHD